MRRGAPARGGVTGPGVTPYAGGDGSGSRRMDTELFMLLNGVLTFGAPLALAARELLVLRRDRGGDGSGRGERAPDTPPTPSPAGNKPLPDCLIPKPLPSAVARARVLEGA